LIKKYVGRKGSQGAAILHAAALAHEPHVTSSLMKADIAKQLMEHVERGLENCAAPCEPHDHDADRRGYNIDRDKQDGSIFQTFLPFQLRLAPASSDWVMTSLG
jgi:hypothetical protein